jgi:hypothetical protein
MKVASIFKIKLLKIEPKKAYIDFLEKGKAVSHLSEILRL